MVRIRRRGGTEILLVLASAALVIVLPIETGMLLAIVMSFVHSLYIVARPSCVELARLPGTTMWWPPAPGAHGRARGRRARDRACRAAQLHQCRVLCAYIEAAIAAPARRR